jgi:hypothetical protein
MTSSSPEPVRRLALGHAPLAVALEGGLGGTEAELAAELVGYDASYPPRFQAVARR